MPDREKLIELLRVQIYPHLNADPYEVIADHLIANGVTVQQWIPVTERLPEYEQQVLTYRGESGISIERMFTGAFWDFDYDIIDVVTHWMPLPQPPKGDG